MADNYSNNRTDSRSDNGMNYLGLTVALAVGLVVGYAINGVGTNEALSNNDNGDIIDEGNQDVLDNNNAEPTTEQDQGIFEPEIMSTDIEGGPLGDRAGENGTVWVDVRNSDAAGIADIELEVLGQNEEVLETQTQEIELQSGEERQVRLYFTIPENAADVRVDITPQ